MKQQAKREKKLKKKKAKKAAREGSNLETQTKVIDIEKPITLEDLTNPDKK